MLKNIAQFFSFIFHPLFMPLIGVSILFSVSDLFGISYSGIYQLFFYAILIINTLIIPLIVSLILMKRGLIRSLQMDSCKERILPYFFTLVMYLITLWLFIMMKIAPIILFFNFGACFSILILLMAALFNLKLSAHLIGLGGIVGMLITTIFVFKIELISYLSVFILISGIVASSRLQLRAHKSLEIYAAFLLGVLSQLFLLY